MNIYDDYVNYMNDKEDLVLKLKNTSSDVMILIDGAIKILDYIYRKQDDGAKLNEELEEIFDLAFGYISNTLEDLTVYYHDFFEDDIILFNKYSRLIMNSIILDDVKGFLDSKEYLTEERNKQLTEASSLIEKNMINKLEYTDNDIAYIEELIYNTLPTSLDYTPSYTVFELICEELGIM